MFRSMSDLMGYEPYQYVAEFNGKWVKFNQTSSGYAGVLGLTRIIKKKIKQQFVDDGRYGGVCQGTALKYIESNCSIDTLFSESQSEKAIKIKSMIDAVNYQIAYGGVNEIQQAVVDSTKINGALIYSDQCPNLFDMEEILDRIERNSRQENKANIFYLTGYCRGMANGNEYSGAHGFVISHVGTQWKFFEALRGEVVFNCFEEFKKWFLKESYQGALKEFTSFLPVTVKPNVTRRYTEYQLDFYRKDGLEKVIEIESEVKKSFSYSGENITTFSQSGKAQSVQTKEEFEIKLQNVYKPRC